MHRTLSCRELEILSLVMQGKTSKEIATLVKLRVETVRSYRKAMMKKLEVNNVAGLVRFLLSDEGVWINGQCLGIDGGLVLR